MRDRFFEDLDSEESSRRVSLNSLLIVVSAFVMMGLGLVIRNNTLNATVSFNDPVTGIRGQLPANWLINTGSDEYVFRAENTSSIPFKTLIQASIQVVGEQANPQSVTDLLDVQGPVNLSGYRVLSTTTTTLNEDDAILKTYAYVETEANPFLETLPIDVIGLDLIVIRGNQAIIFTFRDAKETFEQNRFYFDNFLDTVEY